MGKSSLWLCVIMVLGIAALRTFVFGWGPPAPDSPSSRGPYGIVASPQDNLSYCAWAHQALDGRWRFANLNTTTGHNSLFLNPFLLLVGRIASLFSASPITVLNVLALAAIPLFIFSVTAACRTLGLTRIATSVALCLVLGGGGISWVRVLISLVGLGDALEVGRIGPDLYYYDLYPATAFLIYPFHAVSLAALAFLSLAIIRFDRPDHGSTYRVILSIAPAALLTTAVRPYGPVMLAIIYGSVVIATCLFNPDRFVLRRRLVLMGSLVAGMCPMTVYTLWLSRQPFWGEFAHALLDVPRGDWAAGFFFLWLLGGIGLVTVGSRTLKTAFALPVFWMAGTAILLIVLNSGYTKLCAGCTIPMGILAGVAVMPHEGRVRSRAMASLMTVVVLLLSLGSPSLVVAKTVLCRDRVHLASGLIDAAAAIRRSASRYPVVVLTDAETGGLLPGLTGFRVFCGHWCLTGNQSGKSLLLRESGFREPTGSEGVPPAAAGDKGGMMSLFGRLRTRMGTPPDVIKARHPNRRETVATLGEELLERIRAGGFQFVLVRKDHELYRSLTPKGPPAVVYEGSEYLAVELCPEVAQVIERRVADAVYLAKQNLR